MVETEEAPEPLSVAKILKAIVESTIDPEGDAKLFKASCAKINASKGVGILGKHPTLSLNV